LAVYPEESFALARPVVPVTRDGAARLGSAYWQEVERSTRGAIRARRTPQRVELRFFGRAPALLRFGAPQLQVDPTATETVARGNDIATLVPFEPTPFDEAARTALPARDAV
jgi:hypothetical protein